LGRPETTAELNGLVSRLLPLLTIATAMVALSAGPAGADPPRPTDYRSSIRSIEPAADGIEVDVVGGDSFLQLTADEGHEVVVLGYEDEPYLRFSDDGTVEENQRSPATYLNRDRKGGAAVPPSADAEADPEWREVADDGRWAWHDHRIHWMGAEDPLVDRNGRVTQYGPDGWSVALEVDGVPTLVRGDLVRVDGVSPLPTVAALAGVLALGLFVGRRRPLAVAGVLTTAAAAVALFLGWAEWSAAPPGGGVSPVMVILPAIALVGAVAGLVLRSGAGRAIGVLTAAAAIGAWAFSRIGVVTHAVLPTPLEPWVDRLGLAAAVGAVLAAGVLAVRSGALAPPSPAAPSADAADGTLSA
jgi:hypothetical protein